MNTTDQWQWFRLFVWPFVVGGGTVLMMYNIMWLITGSRLVKRHAVVCSAWGIIAWFFSAVIASRWNNSPAYWGAFTIGLTVLAGILVFTSVMLVRRIWKER